MDVPRARPTRARLAVSSSTQHRHQTPRISREAAVNLEAPEPALHGRIQVTPQRPVEIPEVGETPEGAVAMVGAVVVTEDGPPLGLLHMQPLSS